ncbi:uracil-DNA glycosylase, family 4 [Natronoarchaeum philippinense]|uniref:Uracil-DNA glycosylase, family 4 n=1 Tax=Natronoarchaeum philippinense TaxID=558529 RepID=A0A285N499_NATPI|nr:uracil-DNA glycosylase family protein [Natronoarchaeum philippinense]SNZ04158.1 uracil-DNA glycosylase, family 4 [Natronoarchaeum philippinense]
MENVTDRTSNPFGMQPPCDRPCSSNGPEAVFGFGDANADFHVIGDHPGVHGGAATGVPFTDSTAGRRLQTVLREVGLLADADDGTLDPSNAFLSYLHMCCPAGESPSEDDYAQLEPFFDAELRAIAAHVLVPVGERATRHVLQNYSARPARSTLDMRDLHADEVRGSGFLIVPVRDPAEWTDTDDERLVARLQAMLAGDYRQTTDLSRFLADDELYMVR